MPPSTERLQQIALMYAADNGELHRLVERRGSPEHATVEDACAFAWTRLLTAEQVDLRAPRCHALAWLTTVAVHEAWRLNAIARRAGAVDPDMVDAIAPCHAPTTSRPSTCALTSSPRSPSDRAAFCCA
jgi:hypothetical protein